MSLKTTIDDQPALLAWAKEKTGAQGWVPDSLAIGVVDEATGAYKAVAVFNHFEGHTAAVHFASDGSKRWATPFILSQLFGYAFFVLQLKRLSGYTPADNHDALMLAYRLGFVWEGRQRYAGLDGGDLMLTGMIWNECPWLKVGIYAEEEGDGRQE